MGKPYLIIHDLAWLSHHITADSKINPAIYLLTVQSTIVLLSEAGQAGVLANLLGQGAPYLQRALRDLTEGDDRIRFVTVLGRVLGRFARRSAWGLASRVQHPQLVHQRVPFRGHIYVFVYSLLFSVSVSLSLSLFKTYDNKVHKSS